MAFSGYVRGNGSGSVFNFNPFVEGAKFRIKDFCYLNIIEGRNEDGTPILRTDKDGNKISVPGLGTTLDDVRLTEFYRPTVTADSTSLEKNTQFAKDLVNVLIANRGKSTDEVLQAVVDKFKDRDIVVKSAKPFQGVQQDGSPYTGTFRVYDYA